MREQNRKAIKRLMIMRIAATVIFLTAVTVCLIVNSGKLEIRLPDGVLARDYYPEEEGVVELSVSKKSPNRLAVTAIGRGKVFLLSRGEGMLQYVKILPGGIIYNMVNGDFSGCGLIVLFVHIYLWTMVSLVVSTFILRCRTELYSYTTLFIGGIALFIICAAFDLLLQVVSALESDIFNSIEPLGMSYIFSGMRKAGSSFMYLTGPIMALFVIAFTVSNFVLVKREGFHPANLLGFGISAAIIAGYLFAYLDGESFTGGSEDEARIFFTVRSIYTSVFVYFEAMLLSSSLCAFIAAVKKPRRDKTHVIILGCAVSDDGTPLPLLRGRIDRAIAFADDQAKDTGARPVFVPSGGQGSDEVISEGESMRRYLLSKGIDDGHILPETASTNTIENMRFSLEKIKESCKDPKIAFSTSGYHVLRSGMISEKEGLAAEGIGSKTKWYFWPNAFIREFIGLLAGKWKRHLLWMLLLTGLFVMINLAIPI